MIDEDHVERRRAGLEARAMRDERARLLAEVASGRMTVDGLLEQCHVSQYCPTVKVVVLAEKVPGVGKVRARRAMEHLGIAEDARLGEIDDTAVRALWATMAEAATRPVRDRPPVQSSPRSSSDNER
jgi:hypothetical protein